MKLGLGAVQFGLDYGISNREGKTSPDEAVRIFEIARAEGVSLVDTAYEYGDSEAVIGGLVRDDSAFRIVTKTAKLGASAATAADAERILRAFDESLRRLQRPYVDALLFHSADDLLAAGGERLWRLAESLQEQGRAKKIGASVYTGERIAALMERFPLQIVQLPLNVFDQRLIESGAIDRLHAAGIELHARSAFLQGLLLMPLAELPPRFIGVKDRLTEFHARAGALGLSAAALALDFVRRLPQIHAVVCGVNNSVQFLELVHAFKTQPVTEDLSDLAVHDVNILDPARWSQAS